MPLVPARATTREMKRMVSCWLQRSAEVGTPALVHDPVHCLTDATPAVCSAAVTSAQAAALPPVLPNVLPAAPSRTQRAYGMQECVGWSTRGCAAYIVYMLQHARMSWTAHIVADIIAPRPRWRPCG
jgi:hypothetical protein